MHAIIEETVRQARRSPHINQASGVSVRASIAALECVVSAAELRAIRSGDERVIARPCDLNHIASAFRGKIELMIAEDAPDGASTEDRLIHAILGEAVKAVLGSVLSLPDVEALAEPFADGMRLALDDTTSAADAVASMRHVAGLLQAAERLAPEIDLDPADEASLATAGELILEFLYVHNRLSKVSGVAGAGYAR
jgi:magnesium chelatase subunit I